MKISLVGATRRPEQMLKVLEGAFDLHSPQDYEVVLRIDDDIVLTPRQDFGFNFYCDQLLVGPRLGKGAARPINEAAMAATGDIVMQVTDDQEFVTPGWDDMLQNVAKLYEGVPTVFQVNEGRSQLENAIVNRAWLDEIGFFYPPEFLHFFADTWIETVATKAGRLVLVPAVEIKHHKGINRGDDAYRECREGYAQDAEAFIKMREQIEEIALKIRSKALVA
jgi:hypothetical protein